MKSTITTNTYEAVQQPEIPAGAVHNGRVLADRLEQNYGFECEAGSLAMCSEWQEFRACFEHLANALQQPDPRPESKDYAHLLDGLDRITQVKAAYLKRVGHSVVGLILRKGDERCTIEMGQVLWNEDPLPVQAPR